MYKRYRQIKKKKGQLEQLQKLQHNEKVLCQLADSDPENVVLQKLLSAVNVHITKLYVAINGPACFDLD